MLAKTSPLLVAAVLLFDGGLCDCYCDEFVLFSCECRDFLTSKRCIAINTTLMQGLLALN